MKQGFEKAIVMSGKDVDAWSIFDGYENKIEGHVFKNGIGAYECHGFIGVDERDDFEVTFAPNIIINYNYDDAEHIIGRATGSCTVKTYSGNFHFDLEASIHNVEYDEDNKTMTVYYDVNF